MIRVKELIQYLKTQPPNAVVYGWLPNYGDVGIDGIEDTELQLGDHSVPFDCQEYIENEILCDEQCEHCKEYYSAIKDNK